MALLSVFAPRWAKRGLKTLSAVWFVMSALLLSGALQSPAQTALPRSISSRLFSCLTSLSLSIGRRNAFPEAQTPLVIGVLGEDPFGTYLDEIVRGETVNNRQLAVQRYRRVDEMKTCHILFISQSESKRLEQILASFERPQHPHRGRLRWLCSTRRHDPIRHGKKQAPAENQPGGSQSRQPDDQLQAAPAG